MSSVTVDNQKISARAARAIARHPEPGQCRYCACREIVKRGTRQKKFERVQLYQYEACRRTFSAGSVKGKSVPLRVIFDGLSYFNLGYSPLTLQVRRFKSLR